jgi:hypothetical protein
VAFRRAPRYIVDMTLRLSLLAVPFALAALPAMADDAPKTDALPGVDSSYSLVNPPPEPPAPVDGTGTKRVGNWELTVSGYVWVQVGASSRD